MPILTFIVNGTAREVDVLASDFLATVLRERLGLTGTKIGCNEAECGICTVLVDGVPVNSCIYPALKAAGRAITTIEGLAEGERLHPLQQAFVDHGAVQCGFCTPGLVMAVEDLLARDADPDDLTVREAVSGNLCRCTGYGRVLAAIERAVAATQTSAREDA